MQGVHRARPCAKKETIDIQLYDDLSTIDDGRETPKNDAW
jgi:hypothetical protein